VRDNVSVIPPYLLTLARPIEAPKVDKASTIVAVACRWRYRLKFNANVNYPLKRCLHYGDHRSKLGLYKNVKKIFFVLPIALA
jgi:hypothetical protein